MNPNSISADNTGAIVAVVIVLALVVVGLVIWSVYRRRRTHGDSPQNRAKSGSMDCVGVGNG